jgi:chitinase
MNRLKLAVCILMLPLLVFARCKNDDPSPTPETPRKLRVLGYLFSHGNWATAINNIDLTSVTDLNIAFINPDATGSFAANGSLKQVVEKAHAQKLRVFVSIGGGEPPEYLKPMLEPANRNSYIASIVAMAQAYNFDGVDVDLENSFINENYAPFVSGLSAALKPTNKLMTAALASWNSNQIADSTLQLYDFINIMSYDKTGPWNTSNPGQHSPFSMAQADFSYYRGRNIAAEKLFIGLPFYGYGFGANAPASMNYKDIVATYPGSENKDEVDFEGGGKLYYNGMGTILQKVNFALANNAGGVMIWELQQDSKDAKSLLKVIDDAVKK